MKQTTVTNISRGDIKIVTYLDFHHSLQDPKIIYKIIYHVNKLKQLIFKSEKKIKT